MPKKSNFDPIWTEPQRTAASEDGWELAFVIDEGMPVTSHYVDVFDRGPKHPSKRAAMQHVIAQARAGSKLHISALSVCQVYRLRAQAGARTKGKK